MLNGLLFFLGLELDDFHILGTDGLWFYGWAGQKLPEFQPFCEELRPEKLGLSKVSLLDQFETFPLFL
jgi:hypothetical protein